MPETKVKPKTRTMMGKFWLIVRAFIGIMLVDRWIFKPMRMAKERPAPWIVFNWGSRKPKPEPLKKEDNKWQELKQLLADLRE